MIQKENKYNRLHALHIITSYNGSLICSHHPTFPHLKITIHIVLI